MKLHAYLIAILVLVALTLVAYHALPTRSFAADDFQWLLGAHRLRFTAMLRSAFDPGQSHFYRPIIWISFWLQAQVFGLDPRGYHIVSLVLHLANALLLGWLCYRLTNDGRRTTDAERSQSAHVQLPISNIRDSTFIFRLASFLLPAAFVALHPAPFEAVVWVSGQSELLAAFWLLLLLHTWLAAQQRLPLPTPGAWLLAAVFLTLALLTKESAVIGLPLVVLLALTVGNNSYRFSLSPGHLVTWSRQFVLPTLLTCAYLGVQLQVERANYIVDQGGYGFGPQLLLNPLRSLGLLIAPLPGSEHADASWLIGVGLLAALALLGLLLARRKAVFPILALGLTLLPTTPFASPPDSRYLYPPVLAMSLLVASLWITKPSRHVERTATETVAGPRGVARALQDVAPWWLLLAMIIFALLATAELSAREQRFATASGADGSLFQLAATRCTSGPTDRVIILNPPIAEIHARAILDLACGNTITPIFVDSLAIAQANLEANSLIIDFPNGSARIAAAQ